MARLDFTQVRHDSSFTCSPTRDSSRLAARTHVRDPSIIAGRRRGRWKPICWARSISTAALALQQRLVYEAGGRQDATITLLVCEHPPIITIGRGGSRAQLRASAAELASRQIEVRWVNRGGGA